MSQTIAVKIPDSTGGHYEMYEGITTQLGARLAAGYPVYGWGPDNNGVFGPQGQMSVTAVSADGSSIVPLSTPGAGFLLNGCPLNVIFGSPLGSDQAAVLAHLGIVCSSASVSAAMSAPPSGGFTNAPAGTTQQGGLTPFSTQPTSSTSSTVAAAISTSLTPGAPGSIPSGGGQTNTQPNLSYIYRFILNSAPNRYDTGANYPGCSQVNTAMCDPQQFTTLQQAVNYAQFRNETPYIVQSAAEVWGLIAGTIPINPSQVYGASSGIPWGLIAVAAVALFVVTKGMK